MTRQTLPTRRPNLTVTTAWEGHEILVTVGFDPSTGEPMEVFANAAKGGAMAATLADASVLVSIALQHGVAPDALAKSLGRVPTFTGAGMGEGPASPVGAVLEVVRGCLA